MATCVCPFPRTMCPDCRCICEACVAVGRKWARADIVPATAPAPEVATLTCAKYGLSTACFGEVRERDSDALFSQRAAGAATASGKVTMCDGCWAVRAAYDTLRNDLIKSIAPPDDIRTERDQARSDLATERTRSAVLTRALEVARGALARVAERGELTEWGFERGGKKCIEWVCHGCQGKYINVAPGDRCMNEHCVSVIASRALTAINAVTGGGAATGGTPGAGEAPPACEKPNCHPFPHREQVGCLAATPVAQRRPAREPLCARCGGIDGREPAPCSLCAGVTYYVVPEADRRGEP